MSPGPQELLRALMRGAPFQPATNLWRAVELAAVLEHGLPVGRGLDLGCGDGKLTAILQRASPDAGARRWVGIDIDPLETEQARALGLYEAVHTGSAQAIALADASVDFVFSNSVLEHIAPIHEVLREAARVLRPGGRFLATVPGPGLHAALRGGFPYGRMGRADYLREIDRRCAHLRYWDAAQWVDELRALGLSQVAVGGYFSPAQVRRWERVSNLTGGVLVQLSGGAQRPIELQRRLGLRRPPGTLMGHAAAALAPALAWGCDLAPRAIPVEQAGCLLIDASKT